MSIERRVQLVERLFHQLEQENVLFKEKTTLKCVASCGKCCTYPDIEASPLEFLPWAFYLFLNDEAEKTLQLLSKKNTATCFIYKPLTGLYQGRCSNYKYRGLICRLFGFGANTDKYGVLRLATCKIIKESQFKAYTSTAEAITKGLHVPVFTAYYMQLNQIDFHLGNLILPIDKALKMAIEEVLLYYAYRPSPDIEKNCG